MHGSLGIDLGYGFSQRRLNIADLYRSRLEQSFHDRTRKVDRAVNRDIAKRAARVAKALVEGHNFWLAGNSLPLVRALPWPPERRSWLIEVRDALLLLHKRLQQEGNHTSAMPSFAAELMLLAKQLSVTDDARVHLMYMLDGGQPRDLKPIHLSEALDLIASAATKAHGIWRATRGPEPRSALQLLAADIYAAVVEARGEPLKLLVADKAGYTGQPENDDTRFLLDFVKSVHESIPAELRERQPHLTRDGAILNAYKEYSEAMNRAAKLPA